LKAILISRITFSIMGIFLFFNQILGLGLQVIFIIVIIY
jgi:hypothetical protein